MPVNTEIAQIAGRTEASWSENLISIMLLFKKKIIITLKQPNPF